MKRVLGFALLERQDVQQLSRQDVAVLAMVYGGCLGFAAGLIVGAVL